jgi:hypothetical protein|tara:strand:+ start:132 stop:932 length:801 start_codon:yes stop_codon:yes gene_type:complete
MNKHSGRIPSWFNLENYPPSTDPAYWITMIQCRVALQEFRSRQQSGKKRKAILYRFQRIIEDTETLAKAPESPNAEFIRLAAVPKQAAFIMRGSDLDHLSKWSRRSSDFVKDHEYIGGVLGSRVSRQNSSIEDKQKALQIRHQPITGYYGWENTLDTPGCVPFMVNINRTSRQIIKDISAHLKEHGAKTKDPIKLFEDWSEYRILAYFDLKTWSELDIEIPDKDIGLALFPDRGKLDYVNRRERMRSTLPNCSTSVFRHETIYSLQ